ncbi:MAG: peptide ABC transporter substrate-binding protein [Lachnospiraceae bacterium]|nr:peptide ABC transporter substrate-binding protein [Lachnospiraceae bacterium]
MKKLTALLLSAVMVLSLAACGDSARVPADSGNTDTTATTTTDTASADTASSDTASTDTSADASADASADTSAEGSSINVCLASEPASIDPALNSAVDGATLLVHLFSGLAKWDQKADGTLDLVPDAATDLPEGVENGDGTVTYTYTLRDGLTWSDGQPVTANDFVFAWNRAASDDLAADYGYMFEVVDGYDEVAEGSADSMNIQATDDKTIVVTLKNAVAYWNELLAFPTYFPVREDVVANESWATDPATFVCNGPYTMTQWNHNSLITLTKNDKFVDADTITMNEINFYLSDDANNMLTNFENGSWQLIDDVPTNEIAALKDKYPDEFIVTGQLGTYYVCWNVNENILPAGSSLSGAEAEKAEQEIRNAVGLFFDRNYIVEEIGQAGQVPAGSFVAMGLTDADGSQFYDNANGGKGSYYDVSADALQSNFDIAVETLKKYYTYDESTGKFTDFPVMTYLYNTSEGHKAIGEYLQSALAQVGITMNLENQEWNTFLETRKNGDYSIARNGWLADYNDPICFLDMWTTASGNNDVQFGKGGNESIKAYSIDLTDLGYDTKVTDGTWAETYDVVISDIKTCTDSKTRYALMHKAEDLLMSTGCICPLYFYTDIYMLDKNIQGFFSNPLGYKYFMFCHQ